MQKDPSILLHATADLGPSAAEETQLLFDDVVFGRDADLRELFTTRRTFVDRTLARVYGVRAPEREGFGPVELPEDGDRAGLLGHASILAAHAHPTSSSATLRGWFVRSTLLCQPLPSPPADVDTSIAEPTPELPTLRDRIQVHFESPMCAGCHLQMDPIGLGLENFDGLGVHRERENGALIDASGDLDGILFDGPRQLGEAVAAHPELIPCLVEQLGRHALGRHVADGEQEARDWLVDRLALQGHRLQPLWKDLVTSPLFRRVGEVD